MATSALLHFDSSTWTDEAGHSIFEIGSFVSQNTSQKVFGASSIEFGFEGALGISRDSALDLSTGDWCIEGWFRPLSTAAASVIAIGDNSSGGIIIEIAGGKWQAILRQSGAATTLTSSVSVISGSFRHVALSRSGNTIRLFVNGNQEASASFSGAIDDPGLGTELRLAYTAFGGAYFQGQVDEFRVSKGDPVYTASFSVPTAAFTLSGPPPSAEFALTSPISIQVLAIAGLQISARLAASVSVSVSLSPPTLGSSGQAALSAAAQLAVGVSGNLSVFARFGTAISMGLRLGASFPQAGIVEAWSLAITVGGVDISSRLTNLARIEAEEGAARVAEFEMVPLAGAVDPESWIGASVVIQFELRTLFTGVVDSAEYDPVSGTVLFTATDNLQSLVADLDRSALDALVGGRWHRDVFDATTDNWQYAQDLLSTVPRALDVSPLGVLRASPWASNDPPAFEFGVDALLFDSLALALPSKNDRVNRVEIEFDYRYSRLRQREHTVTWTTGLSFCGWFAKRFSLPPRAVIEEAAQNAGWSVQAGSFFGETTIPSAANPCLTGVDWENFAQSLEPLLNASWRAAVRVSQSVTEAYRLRMECPSTIAQGVRSLTLRAVAQEADQVESEWESALFDARPAGMVLGELGDWVSHASSSTRRQAVLRTLLDQAAVSILAGHRGYRVSWQTTLRPELDLVHNCAVVSPRVAASGKVVGFAHEFDFERGSALTQITIDASKAGLDWQSVTTLPSVPSLDRGLPAPGTSTVIGVQIGNSATSAAFDDALNGWSSNYEGFVLGAPVYPQRFRLKMPDIEPEARDPVTYTRTKTDYAVVVVAPDLTLAA